ncbi:hypothetical protein V6N11_036659 [Hibiscus sabdariffa]|uniref:Uncharacterized protein n=1 Tax=Hibiscus sabdariffa TaxID=183260 RepID=A0ABR2RBC6_9ROSI
MGKTRKSLRSCGCGPEETDLVVAFGSETQHLFLVLYLSDRRAFQDLPRFLQPALVPILPDKMGWQSKRIH